MDRTRLRRKRPPLLACPLPYRWRSLSAAGSQRYVNVLGIVTFSWNAYWAAFFVILLVSFFSEIVWKKYI